MLFILSKYPLINFIVFFFQIKQHLLIRTSYNASTTPCYGLTQNSTTLEYMFVILKMKRDLQSFKKDSPPLEWKVVYYALLQIVRTLYILHKDNLVHKNLHPGNIVQSNNGGWYISDFGLC